MSDSQLRQTRISANIPASYFLKGFQGEGKILDISMGGIGMEVRQIFVPGDLMRIKFRLPGNDAPEVDFWGIVRSVSGNILGIKYEEIANSDIEAINHYMGSALLKLGKSTREEFNK